MLSRLWAFVRRRAPYLMLALIGVVGFIAWQFSDPPVGGEARSHDMELVARLLLVSIGAAPLLVVAWFLYLFTGVEVTPRKIEQIILFCYLFTGIALVGSIVPFLAFPFAPSLQEIMVRGPVGLTPGCKAQPTGSDRQSLLKELACGNRADQWVLDR